MPSSTILVTTISELRAASRAARLRGKTIGLVPTMGALHAGHLSLVEAARKECDEVVVSVFVNPTQFAPHEDFARYPRDLDADRALLAPLGPLTVFAPSALEMYPPGYQTSVTVGDVSQAWEGAIRPTHFAGVATVVLKLFTACEPDAAYFGQKDFQQLRVIERMTADLNLGLRIHACPIVRDPEGLAMSSRNRYLSPTERERGLALFRALAIAGEMVARGEHTCSELNAAMRDVLSAADLEIDYAVVVDRETLEPLTRLDRPAVAIVAARVGKTRLIDNRRLDPPAL
ncbi:MAG: pantoate--beta-alanine ligase [Pirellulales bacterium]